MNTPETEKPRHGLLSRRKLLVGLAGGALVVGYTASHIGTVASAALSVGAKKPDPSVFGPFIKIDADGWVTVINKYQEMGQGVHVGLAAMVAEELDADWEKIKIESAPANAAVYKNKLKGLQATAGSSAIADSWDQLRHAGAAARAMFVAAAAARWNVPVHTVRVENGIVHHDGSGRAAGFEELLIEAAQISPPTDPVLKDPKEYALIGTDRVRRKDSREKSSGATRYTQDVQLPNMLTAMVLHAPRFGAKRHSMRLLRAKYQALPMSSRSQAELRSSRRILTRRCEAATRSRSIGTIPKPRSDPRTSWLNTITMCPLERVM
jgi:isoquinoline 1-oxidoreductase beta subunit